MMVSRSLPVRFCTREFPEQQHHCRCVLNYDEAQAEKNGSNDKYRSFSAIVLRNH